MGIRKIILKKKFIVRYEFPNKRGFIQINIANIVQYCQNITYESKLNKKIIVVAIPIFIFVFLKIKF